MKRASPLPIRSVCTIALAVLAVCSSCSSFAWTSFTTPRSIKLGPLVAREIVQFNGFDVNTSCVSRSDCLALVGESIFELNPSSGNVRGLSLSIDHPDNLDCSQAGGCLVFSSGCTGSGSHCSTAVDWRAADATSWRTIFSQSHSRNFYDGGTCSDSDHCVLVGNENDGPAIAAVTDNGGMNWGFESSSQLGNAWDLPGVSCTSPEHCITAGARYPGNREFALVSNNGGRTWSKSTVFSTIPSGQQTAIGSGYSSGIQCVGSVCTDSASIPLVSADGGTTWSSVETPSQVGQLYFTTNVICISASSCFEFGIGGTMSFDHWVSELQSGVLSPVQATSVSLDSAQCLSPTLCVIAFSTESAGIVATVNPQA